MSLRQWPNNIESYINDSADRAGVSRTAFRALLYSESTHGQDNTAGYVGYGQLSSDYVNKFFNGDLNAAHDPAANIDAAAKVYAEKLKIAKGDDVKAAWLYKGMNTIPAGDHANKVFQPFLDNLKALRSKGDSTSSQSNPNSPAKSGDIVKPAQYSGWLNTVDEYATALGLLKPDPNKDYSKTSDNTGSADKQPSGWETFKKYMTPSSLSLIFILAVLVVVTANGFISTGNPVAEVIQNG